MESSLLPVDLKQMLHGKVITIKRKYQLFMLALFDKQLPSYLQVTGFKSSREMKGNKTLDKLHTQYPW